MKKNITIPLISGIAVSALALFFAFRNVPFSQLIDYMSSINYLWVIPSVLIVFLSFAARALRWQIILETSHKIGFWQVFHTLMIGFMLNCILPARLGEIARPAILLKNNNVPFSVGLATVATERLFDLILLIIFFVGVLSFVQIDSDFNHSFGELTLNKSTLENIARQTIKLCLILFSGIILISIERSRKIIIDVILKIPSMIFFASKNFKNRVQTSLCLPIVKIIDNFASGFKLVKYPKKVFKCFVISFFVWILAALSYYTMSLGCPGVDLGFFEITAVMIIICFFIAIPSVPGYWGLWEAGGIFALYLFGVSKEVAGGYTLANHAIQILPVIIAGLMSAILTGVNVWHIKYQEKPDEND